MGPTGFLWVVWVCVGFYGAAPQPRSAIVEAAVTEPPFLEQLRALDAKMAAVKELAFHETAACADVQHVLQRLKDKVGPTGGTHRVPHRWDPQRPIGTHRSLERPTETHRDT